MSIPLWGWPEDYGGDLLVIDRDLYNGNFSEEYKVIRHNFDKEGNYMGTKDFFKGNPAGIVATPVNGSFISDLYISDDKAGVIYRISYRSGHAWRFLESEN